MVKIKHLRKRLKRKSKVAMPPEPGWCSVKTYGILFMLTGLVLLVASSAYYNKTPLADDPQKFNEIQQEILETQHKSDEPQQEINEPHEEFNDLEQEINKPQQVINEPQREINEPQQEINEPQKEINEPQQELNELKREINEPQQDINEPQTQMAIGETQGERVLAKKKPKVKEGNCRSSILKKCKDGFIRPDKSCAKPECTEPECVCEEGERNDCILTVSPSSCESIPGCTFDKDKKKCKKNLAKKSQDEIELDSKFSVLTMCQNVDDQECKQGVFENCAWLTAKTEKVSNPLITDKGGCVIRKACWIKGDTKQNRNCPKGAAISRFKPHRQLKIEYGQVYLVNNPHTNEQTSLELENYLNTKQIYEKCKDKKYCKELNKCVPWKSAEKRNCAEYAKSPERCFFTDFLMTGLDGKTSAKEACCACPFGGRGYCVKTFKEPCDDPRTQVPDKVCENRICTDEECACVGNCRSSILTKCKDGFIRPDKSCAKPECTEPECVCEKSNKK